MSYPEPVQELRMRIQALRSLPDWVLDLCWASFSEECYCASYLFWSDSHLEHFKQWLERRMGE